MLDIISNQIVYRKYALSTLDACDTYDFGNVHAISRDEFHWSFFFGAAANVTSVGESVQRKRMKAQFARTSDAAPCSTTTPPCASVRALKSIVHGELCARIRDSTEFLCSIV